MQRTEVLALRAESPLVYEASNHSSESRFIKCHYASTGVGVATASSCLVSVLQSMEIQKSMKSSKSVNDDNTAIPYALLQHDLRGA